MNIKEKLLIILLAVIIFLVGIIGIVYNVEIIPVTIALIGVILVIGVVITAIHSSLYRTWKSTFQLLAVISIFPWFMEVIGVKFGFPFGVYSYARILPFEILGVSIFVILAWIAIIYASYNLALLLLKNNKHKEIFVPMLAGVMAVAWDLLLDPIAVAEGLWGWEKVGFYFGIPFLNFVGWFFVTAVSVYLFMKYFENINNRPHKYNILIPILTYFLLYFCVAYKGITIGMYEVVAVGSAAMLPFIILALYKLRKIGGSLNETSI